MVSSSNLSLAYTISWCVSFNGPFSKSWRALALNPLLYPNFRGMKFKDKGHPMTCLCRHTVDAEVQLQRIRNLALEEGVDGQHHAPAALLPGKPRYSLYRRLGGPRADLDGTENLGPTGIRSPNHPARSKSLNRLCCPGRIGNVSGKNVYL